MKQFYYGNDLFGKGYSVLASTPDIPENIQKVMIDYISGITDKTNGEYGMLINQSSALIYCNTVVPPRVDLGEQRGTYFSHQYYISGSEIHSFVESMPRILSGLTFVQNYSESYDTSDKPVNTVFAGYDAAAPDQMTTAVKYAINENKKIVISSQNMSKSLAMQSMVKVIASLSNAERVKANFMMCGNIADDRLKSARIILCNSDLYAKFKQRYGDTYVFYDIDTNKWFFTPPPVEPVAAVVHTPKQNAVQQEYTPTTIVSDDEEDDDYMNKKSAKLLVSLSFVLCIISIILSVVSFINTNKTAEQISALEAKLSADEATEVNTDEEVTDEEVTDEAETEEAGVEE